MLIKMKIIIWLKTILQEKEVLSTDDSFASIFEQLSKFHYSFSSFDSTHVVHGHIIVYVHLLLGSYL